MTKEELEKEATEWVRQKFPMLDLKQSDMSKIHEYEAYIASAEPREKRIAEFEAQIEKMKCCEICAKSKDWRNRGLCVECEQSKSHINFELRG